MPRNKTRGTSVLRFYSRSMGVLFRSLIDAKGLSGVAGAMLVPVALLLPIAWVVTSRDPTRVAGVPSAPIHWGRRHATG